MTMCLIQVNLETGEAKLCNAGHESPYFLKRMKSSGSDAISEATALLAKGERLGFHPDSQYSVTPFEVSPGDTLLLFTDGISEAENTSGKQWGERKLRKAFSKQGARPLTELKQQIVEALNSHIQGAEQKDDLTFVLFTFKPKKEMSEPKPAQDSEGMAA